MVVKENKELTDAFARKLRYLRLSVTDRCNFRCSYCTQEGELEYIPHTDILSYEEMIQILNYLVLLGIEKVRLTGGEPFVRKGFPSFVLKLRESFPSIKLHVTTNATQLASNIEVLEKAEVNGINISFDSFIPEVFNKITRSSFFEQSYTGLMAALASSIPVKLNVVALRGINSQELASFLDFAVKYAIDVRFIEYMPFGGSMQWGESCFWSGSDILEESRLHVSLKEVSGDQEQNKGPARMFTIEGTGGRLGIISAVSEHFCQTCDRLRITAEGGLRSCLFSDQETSLREILRAKPFNETELVQAIEQSVLKKPMGNVLFDERKNTLQVIKKGMSSIGG